MSNIKNLKCQTSKTSVQSLRRTASETAEQQQDSCPNHAIQRPRTMPKRCLRNALGEQCRWMSFQNLCVQSLWRTACETAEQQQDSCPNHAKQRPRTMPKCCLRNALGAEWASKTFGGPLWNVKHQKPCETATTNNAETLPTKRSKRRRSFQNLWRTAMKCHISKTSVPSLRRTACETAEQKQNSDHEQCRNVAYETHQKLASQAFGGPQPNESEMNP